MKTRKKGYSAPPEQMSSVMASSSQFVRETSMTGVFSETWKKVTTQKYIWEIITSYSNSIFKSIYQNMIAWNFELFAFCNLVIWYEITLFIIFKSQQTMAKRCCYLNPFRFNMYSHIQPHAQRGVPVILQ